MAAYLDFYRKHYGIATKRSKSQPKPHTFRLYFLYGAEYVLIKDVIDAVAERIDASERRVVLTAGEIEDADIWLEISRPTSWDERKLVVVRNADSISDWEPLKLWLKDTAGMANVHLIFVSREPKIDTKADPYIWMKKPTTTLVKCGPLNPDNAVTYLQTKATGLDRYTAMHLLERVGSSLPKAVEALMKASYFPAALSNELVDALTDLAENVDFVDELIALRKANAIRAIPAVPEDSYAEIVGQLDDQLDLLAKINEASRFRQSAAEISKASKVPRNWVHKLREPARFYTQQKVVSCAQVLSVIDAQLARGERQAVLETLVALW